MMDSDDDHFFSCSSELDLAESVGADADEHDEHDDHSYTAGKGKAPAKGRDGMPPAGLSELCALPPELIYSILSYLSPVDVAAVSGTCHALYAHARSDSVWQAIVQAHVPGVRLASPFPCPDFRSLYIAHDPRWFLPKYKIWFSDRELTGKLVVARYDPRRGCIEGYQLVAVSKITGDQWQPTDQTFVAAFEPSVALHLDRPILQFDAIPRSNNLSGVDGPRITRIPLRPDFSIPGPSDAVRNPTPPSRARHSRWQVETPMDLGSSVDSVTHNTFILARPLSPDAAAGPATQAFPYGGVWPPPVVPSRHRVVGIDARQLHTPPTQGNPDAPAHRSDISDTTFRVRRWLEMRTGWGSSVDDLMNHMDHETEDPEMGQIPPSLTFMEILGRQGITLSRPGAAPLVFHIGEEVATYATLDPELYTPTPEKPWRGIWVGDYSGHGCEFLLIHQPDGPEDGFDPDAIVRRGNETEEQFRQRRRDAAVYRGRMEAIKLTGDPNVPRGEITFVVDDLGDGGFLRVMQQLPFQGARAVRSKLHIANTGFQDDRYTPAELILISHDRLAQHWLEYNHTSFYERVDIDRFLTPD